MAEMQWLRAEQKRHHFHFRVWLDMSKTDADSRPDPRFVRTYRWRATPPVGWTGASLNGVAYTDWASYVEAEIELLAADLTVLDDAVAAILPIQGQSFEGGGTPIAEQTL